MTTVAGILKENGPSRSSIIVEQLVATDKLSKEAARQRVSRAPAPVQRININLPNKEKFLYLSEQFGGNAFLDSLSETLKETKTAAGRALFGLEAHGGVIPEYLFPVFSGAPIQNTKKQLIHSKVLEQLEKNKLIEIIPDPFYEKLIGLYGYHGISQHKKATLLVEDIVLSSVKEWIRKINIASYNKISIRNLNGQRPSFGQFQWDLVGPSFLSGLTTFIDKKN